MADTITPASTSLDNGARVDRSQSRGREPFVSSGRGGAGNIRPSSTSRDARLTGGPDDFSATRGRELPPAHPDAVTHSGRGGAGNVRSPSRDQQGERRALEQEHARVVEHLREEETQPHSSGRGGAGNIARSRSRDPAPSLVGTGTGTTTAPVLAHHAVPNQGRGGYGNIVHAAPAAGYDLAAERAAAHALRDGSDAPHHKPLLSSGAGLGGGVAHEDKVGKLA